MAIFTKKGAKYTIRYSFPSQELVVFRGMGAVVVMDNLNVHTNQVIKNAIEESQNILCGGLCKEKSIGLACKMENISA
jgi:hypothetical protein